MDNKYYKIANEINIKDVITRYATLQGGDGRNTFNCPFANHLDRTASFHIYEETNTYCCFGGGCPYNGSSCIDFVRDFFGIGADDACKKILQDFNIGLCENIKPKPIKQENKSIPLKDYTQFYEKSHKNVGETDYFKSRGFTQATIEKYQLGYAPWMYDGKYAAIIPVTKNFYVNRTTVNAIPKTKNLYNTPVEILNEHYLYEDGEVFVVEGWADALSIDQCGAKAISLNGTPNVRKIIEIKDKIKAKLIVIGDNDIAGEKMNNELKNSLISPYCIDAIPKPFKDANELLIADANKLKEFVQMKREFVVNEKKNNSQKITLDIENLTASTIISKEVKDYLLSFKDLTTRMSENNKISLKAKTLKVGTNYNQFVNTFLQSKDFDNNDTLSVLLPINLDSGSWKICDNGVRRNTPKGIEEACSHPITITRILMNQSTDEKRVELAFFVRGKWNTIIVDANTIANHQNLLGLANKGIMVHTGNAKLLGEYLSTLQERNMNIIPFVRSVSRLGWFNHDEEFSPYNNCVFDGDKGYQAIYDAITTHGSEELSKKVVNMARENKVLRMMVATSLISPLLKPMNQQIFFYHTWGASGLGKSVGLKVTISLHGNPEILLRTMNSTNVAFEKLAAFCNSLPVALDELQGMNSRDEIQSLLYRLCSGISKGRSNKQGTIDVADYWCCTFITTGEQPLTSENFAEGALSRSIELNLKEPAFTDFALVLDLAKENYGFIGKKFIETIQKTGLEDIYKLHKELRTYISTFGFAKKQLNSLAMAFLGDLLFQTIINNVEIDKAIESTKNFIKDIEMELPKEIDINLGYRMYGDICSWVARNISKFDGTDSYGEVYGTLLYKENMNETKEPSHAIIDCGALKEMLAKKNVNYCSVLEGLGSLGCLVKSSRGNTINYRIKSVQTTCIKLILNKTFKKEIQEQMELVPIEDKDLPF